MFTYHSCEIDARRKKENKEKRQQQYSTVIVYNNNDNYNDILIWLPNKYMNLFL